MHILLLKTSSLGDLVHMLPALSDAAKVIPNLRVDWVAEESFAAVPAWHPAVDKVISVAMRRWRKNVLQSSTWQEIGVARQAMRATPYAAVVDAQGLLKSAWMARWAGQPVTGYDRHSIREPLASLFYAHRVAISRKLHAIERNRRLLAAALGYDMDALPLDYGLSGLAVGAGAGLRLPPAYILALHGTSREDKEWPEDHWIALGHGMAAHGRALVLPWGNAREKERAERIAATVPTAQVLPRLGLDALAGVIARADAVLGVDTGLMHVAAALRKPGLALFPATLPALTGVRSEPDAPQIASLMPKDDLRAEAVLERLVDVLVDALA
ncbi:MAG: lipopolysaccharide heptosyltransferase I [Gammaproteobacteria bacterium 28-57-27]|nr:MAG: lipopolysaccharide heptosyltransferase I [Gammaproteobacteria bacterium 28-57-27]